MSYKQTHWVLVADGGQARFFSYSGRYENLQQIIHLAYPHPLNHEQGRDKPGRTFESATILKHAYEPKTDWHDRQKKDFFNTLAQMIIQSYEDKKFKKITLICPAHLMGFLKDKVHPPLKAEDMEMIDKDFTHLPKNEIQKKLLERHDWPLIS